MADAEAEIDALRKEVENLRAEFARQFANYQVLRVSAPLTDVEFTQWQPNYERDDLARYWNAWCPCCKRPLDITVFGAWDQDSNGSAELKLAGDVRQLRYAYVTALWGAGSGFALGAMVLGEALRRSGSKYDLVLLHTGDVPVKTLLLLEQVWLLHRVDYVNASENLFRGGTAGKIYLKA